ncbi:hypothetical protein GCM10029978_063500 [Actinoallomurus acanthiterrae]
MPLTVHRVYEDGWIVLRADGDDIVSAVFTVEGQQRPLALAVLVKGRNEAVH